MEPRPNALLPVQGPIRRCGRYEFLAAAALTVVGLVSRLVYLQVSTRGDWGRLTFPDEANYYLAGARLIHEHGLAYFSSDRSLWNGPLAPIWVLAFSLYAPAVKVANVVLLACAGLLVWDGARARAGRTAGLIAVGLCSAHPPLTVFGPTILSEPPFVFLITLSFWIVHRARGRLRWLTLAGVVMGCAALVRPTLQLWPLFAFAIAAILGITSSLFAAHRRSTAAVLAGFCMVVVPVVAHNAVVLGRPVIANGFGAVLYVGNDLRRDGDEPIYSGFDFDTFEFTRPFTHLDSEGDRRLRKRALRLIQAHPADIALLTARKAVRYLVGEPRSYLFPHRDVLAAARAHSPAATWGVFEMLTTLTTVLLGISGIVRRRRDLSAFLAGSFALYMTALHAVSFAIPRLALPLFPILAVYAGCAVSDLLRRGLRSSFTEGFAAAAVPVAIAAMCLWHRGAPPYLVPSRYASFFDETQPADLSRWAAQGLADTGHDWARGSAASSTFGGPVDPIRTASNQAILVRLSVSDAPTKPRMETVRILWSADGSFDANRSEPFEVLADGALHDYRIVPSAAAGWTGLIGALRLDFTALAPAAVVHVEDVRVVR